VAEATGYVQLAKEPVLGQLHQNAFQVIETQLIPATSAIDRIPVDVGLDPLIRQPFSQQIRIVVVHADAKTTHTPGIPQLIKAEKTLRPQPYIQAPVGCPAADF
jgi:hypothetical protein